MPTTTQPSMTRLKVNEAWYVALFASALQPSDSPTTDVVAEAIRLRPAVKTASGATAVQIVHSSRRGSRDIEHLGSAHDEAELEALKAAARQRLVRGQGEFDLADVTVVADAGMVSDANSRRSRTRGCRSSSARRSPRSPTWSAGGAPTTRTPRSPMDRCSPSRGRPAPRISGSLKLGGIGLSGGDGRDRLLVTLGGRRVVFVVA